MNQPCALRRELAARGLPPAAIAQALAPNAALGQIVYGFAALPPPWPPSQSPSPASSPGDVPSPSPSPLSSSFAMMAPNPAAILNRAVFSGLLPAQSASQTPNIMIIPQGTPDMIPQMTQRTQMTSEWIPQMTPEMVRQIQLLAAAQGVPRFQRGGIAGDGRDRSCEVAGDGCGTNRSGDGQPYSNHPSIPQPPAFQPLPPAAGHHPATRQPLTRRPSAGGEINLSAADVTGSPRRGLKRPNADTNLVNHKSAATNASAPPAATAAAARRRGSIGSADDGASSGGSSSGGGDSPRPAEEHAVTGGATAGATAAAAAAAWEQHQWSRGLAELVTADGYRWLKYGAKKLSTKNGGQRRAYYRCAASSPHHRSAGSAPCPARKVVNSHPLRPFDLTAVTVEYLDDHNHPLEGERERVAVRDYKGRRVPRSGEDAAAVGVSPFVVADDGVSPLSPATAAGDVKLVTVADVSPSVAADTNPWTAAADVSPATVASTGAWTAADAENCSSVAAECSSAIPTPHTRPVLVKNAGDDVRLPCSGVPPDYRASSEEDAFEFRDFMGVGGNGKESGLEGCVNADEVGHDISRSNSGVTEHRDDTVEQLLLRTAAADHNEGSGAMDDGQVDVELHLACSYGNVEQHMDARVFQGKFPSGSDKNGDEGCKENSKRLKLNEGRPFTSPWPVMSLPYQRTSVGFNCEAPHRVLTRYYG
ncbi:hypothetical protein CLOM_g6155 [Closterium sp. NIES-68]|nr:hypothetical protein CLOM_g6155 [Closterium sp. NIES-68]GJP60892.1 hypothetical protein CLOP_g18106 [Closterium sp. NIES-67]